MRSLLFLLFISAAASLLGQTFERSFGLELTPHVNNRRISAGAGVTILELEKIDSVEMGNSGYGIGLVYESRTDRLGFLTGLRYTQAGYETLQQRAGMSSTETFSDVVKAHYLSIPLELNFYQDVTPKDRVLFLLGIGAQYHLSTKTERTRFSDGNETGTDLFEDELLEYRPFLLSFATGIGYDRKLSENWAIRFQPAFQFFLNGNLRPESESAANRNYYQLGLRVVVRKLFL